MQHSNEELQGFETIIVLGADGTTVLVCKRLCNNRIEYVAEVTDLAVEMENDDDVHIRHSHIGDSWQECLLEVVNKFAIPHLYVREIEESIKKEYLALRKEIQAIS